MTLTTSHLDAPATVDDHHRRSHLLLAGTAAGPVFIGSSLLQAATRDGFDVRRHAASLLLNGDLGWVQVLTFVTCGVLLLAGAVGLTQSSSSGDLGRWAPRLIGLYGVSFLGAGVFKADPALGFPVGTPDGAAEITAAGVGHMLFGMVGFVAITAACLVLARRHRRAGRRGWALVSGLTAATFLAAIIGISSGSGSTSAVVTLGFWAAVTVSFGWLSATFARQ